MSRGGTAFPKAHLVSVPELQDWVRGLVNALRKRGIEATYDPGTPGVDPLMKLTAVINAHGFVILVCTPEFRRQFEAREGPVGRLAPLIAGHVHTSRSEHDGVIVLVRSGALVGLDSVVPTLFRGQNALDFRGPAVDPQQFDQLASYLLGQTAGLDPVTPVPDVSPTVTPSSYGLREGPAPLSEEDFQKIYTAAKERTSVSWRKNDTVHDRWQLKKKIRTGGFGEVWRAYDVQDRRVVALKVLRQDAAEEGAAVRRFFQGAEVMASLVHPHIVRVLQPGLEVDGHGFFVMEWLNYGDLEQQILTGPQTLAQVLHWLIPVGQALSFIHDKGYVHRDVKPSNILMGSHGTPKLTDFDLVVAPQLVRNTRTGQAVGSMFYAAPEVLVSMQPEIKAASMSSSRYSAAEVDARADVFSLAMTVVHAIHGGPLPPNLLYERAAYFDQMQGKVPDAVVQRLREAAAVEVTERPDSVKALIDALKTAAREPKTQVAIKPVSRMRADSDLEALFESPSPRTSWRWWGKLAGFLVVVVVVVGWLVMNTDGERPSPSKPEFPITFYIEAVPGSELSDFRIKIEGQQGITEQRYGSEPMHRIRYAGEVGTDIEIQVTPPAGVSVIGGQRQRFMLNRNWAEAPSAIVFPTIHVREKLPLAAKPHRPRMVPIKPGTFTMGSPVEEPGRFEDEYAHEVSLTRGFWLAESEVTQGQWAAVMNNWPSYFRQGQGGGPNHPVERVSWFDALAYANAVSKLENLRACYELTGCEQHICRRVRSISDCDGYRLPNEIEWEYAARALTQTALYTGPIEIPGEHHAPQVGGIGWYGGNSGVESKIYGCKSWEAMEKPSEYCGTHAVMQKPPNSWGLYDMIGNVWEWTEDAWQADLRQIKGPSALRWLSGQDVVFRGCAWDSFARRCRSAYRDHDPPGYRDHNLGLRLARSFGP